MADEKTNPENPSEENLAGNAPDGIQLSDAELAEARKEGAKQDAQESAKETHHALTDGNLPGDMTPDPYAGSDEIQMFAHLIDIKDIDQFKKVISAKADNPLPDNKVAGLYKLERNGPNRTPFVKALRDRLGLKKGEDVPGAGGPPYTNDVTPVTAL